MDLKLTGKVVLITGSRPDDIDTHNHRVLNQAMRKKWKTTHRKKCVCRTGRLTSVS